MVVISLPHASLLHPVALRRPPGPQQSSFISAKQTRVAIPLPYCKCSKRGFSGMPYSTARTKPETPLRTSTAPSPRVAAHLLSGVSPSGTILRSSPGRNPAYRKCCQTPSPTANVLSGVSGLWRATRRYLAQKPRLVSVKPCGCGAGGWWV